MAVVRALPFATNDNALSAKVTGRGKNVHMRSDETWDAYSDATEPFTLEFELASEATALIACLPPGAATENLIELIVTRRSVDSRERQTVCRLELGTSTVALEFDPDHFMGRVDLEFTARLAETLAPVSGFAHLKGSTLARLPLATIWFDEPPTFSGDTLEIRWEDFDEDPTLVDGHIFAVRLEEKPVILLNSAVPSLHPILTSKGTHGASARIRDAVFSQVVHQAWSSILSHCFLEVLRHGDEDPATVLDEIEPWQGQVIRAWAREFVISESEDEAAAMALIERLREAGSEVVLHSMPEAIQSRCRTMNSFHGMIKDYSQLGGATA
jgi:hypothetical protein